DGLACPAMRDAAVVGGVRTTRSRRGEWTGLALSDAARTATDRNRGAGSRNVDDRRASEVWGLLPWGVALLVVTVAGNRLRAGRGCEVAANPHAFASGPIIRWMGRGRMTSPARR